LTEARKVEGHPLQVLQIVASSDHANQAIRQAAAVHFKNIVKKGWDSEAEVCVSKIYCIKTNITYTPFSYIHI
jgi:hypothetical protein